MCKIMLKCEFLEPEFIDSSSALLLVGLCSIVGTTWRRSCICMLFLHRTYHGLDLLDLKLLLVIQGEVDDCEVLRYAVQPPSSRTAPWSRPADSARGEVVQFQDFTFGWHTMQVIEPAQSTLRQGDRDWALFSLLSDSDVSYMLIPFDIFESAQAAHVKCIQSIVITDVQVPRLRSI